MGRTHQQPEKSPILANKIKHITAKAVLIEFIDQAGEIKAIWIPKSQLHEPDELDITDEPTEIYVSPWFIEKEGLE